ncbi:MAG: Gfo/Idh/MocA family oxidoreductase [bacterium]|nr:Gfo/Idh/MocA family oxidoreductase [bacterium]
MITLMTLDPGHFHAALLQKIMYDQVSSSVYVFAPQGDDLEAHLGHIENFNSRSTCPTSWHQQVYQGADFVQQLLTQRPGDVVVIAGINARKAGYIKTAVEAGLHVLADKPMCINPESWDVIKTALTLARQQGTLLSDIMTSRHEITNILFKELVNDANVFGVLERGTPERPAVLKQSTHHLFKSVDGRPLTRPGWYFDVSQQGEGIIDVATHLVDQVIWSCFPQQAIDYADINMLQARRWSTNLTREQFQHVTGLADFPPALRQRLDGNGNLPYSCNGEMLYTIKGMHTKIIVQWDYQAPSGTGDTHLGETRGTLSTVRIRQSEAQRYQPELYVEAAAGTSPVALQSAVQAVIDRLQTHYPGIASRRQANEWHIIIPDRYRIGHEAHFAQVFKTYLQFLDQGAPDWEAPNLLAKYYTTTQALALAQRQEISEGARRKAQ